MYIQMEYKLYENLICVTYFLNMLLAIDVDVLLGDCGRSNATNFIHIPCIKHSLGHYFFQLFLYAQKHTKQKRIKNI